MATPKIYKSTQTIDNHSVECARITCDHEATLRLGSDEFYTGGEFVFQMIARAENARNIQVHVGDQGTTFVLSNAFIKYDKVFKNVSFADNPYVTIIFPAGTYYLYHVKLERGNVKTDWTPHRDDIQEDFDKVYTEIKTSKTETLKTTEELINTAVQNYVRTSDHEQFIQEVSTRFLQSAESVDILFSRMVESIKTVDDTQSREFAEWKSYIRFVDGSIVLGKEENPLVLTLVNNRISFTSSGTEVAYFSDNKMYVKNIEVTDSAVINGLTITEVSDGYLINIEVR